MELIKKFGEYYDKHTGCYIAVFFGSMFVTLLLALKIDIPDLDFGLPALLFLISFLNFFILTKFFEKTDNQKKMEADHQNALDCFYKDCCAEGVKNLSTDINRQKAQLIADRLGYTDYTSLDDFFKESKERNDEEKREQFQQKFNAQLNEERELYESLTKYSSFEGRDKRVAKLTDIQKSYLEKSEALRSGSLSTVKNLQEREIDWASRGGFVSGIAGGAAGVSAAIDAQLKNAEIRANNEARMNAFSPVIIGAIDKSIEYSQMAKKLQPEIDAAKIKLVADTPANEVFTKLDIQTDTVKISRTGAFAIKATVKLVKPVTISDKIKGVVDGTICADLFQEGKLCGTALLVLPTNGVSSSKEIEGICLNGAKQKVPYTIKYSPYHLWIMEK